MSEDIRSINLDDLTRRYRDTPHVQRAVERLDAALESGDPKSLARLLRNHAVEGIYDREEVELRDAFDYLLAFYGLVEIASLIRFVPAPLPEEFAGRASAHLEEPSVVKYYESHYPILLPRLLRQRLRGEHDLHVEPAPETAVLFNQFLELNRIVQEDEHVDTFLWFLDSGIIRGVSIRDTLAALKNPRGLMEQVAKPPGEQDALARSVHGLLKFIAFCREFDALLGQAAEYPLFQSAMWHHHAYWFRRLSNRLSGVLDKTFEQMREWAKLPAEDSGDVDEGTRERAGGDAAAKLEDDEDFPVTERQVKKTQKAVDNLCRGTYGAALEAELGRRTA